MQFKSLPLQRKLFHLHRKKNKHMTKYLHRKKTKNHKQTKSNAVKRLQMNIRLRTLNFRKMLEDKEQQFKELQNEKMALEEKVKEMEEQS